MSLKLNLVCFYPDLITFKLDIFSKKQDAPVNAYVLKNNFFIYHKTISDIIWQGLKKKENKDYSPGQ